MRGSAGQGIDPKATLALCNIGVEGPANDANARE